VLYIKYKKKREKLHRRAVRQSAKARGASREGGFYDSDEWREVRYIALRNNNGKCELCGRGKHDGVKLHVDHIVPRSKNRELELEPTNLQVLCDSCNLGKGNKCDKDWRKEKPLPITLAHSALVLLLHKTELASIAGEIISGPEFDDSQERLYPKQGEKLFIDVVQLLNVRKETTAAMVLGYWYGTEEGRILSRLANQPILIPEESLEQQFRDVLTAMFMPSIDKLLLQNKGEAWN